MKDLTNAVRARPQGENVKLRWKTLAIISVVVTCLVGILFAVTRTIMMQDVADMERKTTSQSIGRVLGALSNELEALDATTQDYAVWDDTYAFIQDGNNNYIDLNLMDATFANLRLNLMLFVNVSGQVVFGKAFDLKNGTEMPFPQGLLLHLEVNGFIIRFDSVNGSVIGTILLPEGPVLVASRPISTSNQQGPVGGALITGRFLDSTELSFLSKATQLPLSAQLIADSPISSDFRTANLSLSKESPIFVQPLTNERIAGYGLLEDVYGNPILIIRADMPRDIYAQAQVSTCYTTLSLIVTGVAFGSLTILLLEKFVIARLTQLSTDVSEISRSGDLSVRVPETGKDELSSLSEGINRMLSALGQTQERLKEERDKAQRYLDIVNVIVVALDRKGEIILLNKKGCKLLGCPSEKILGINWFDNFVPEKIREEAKSVFKSVRDGVIEVYYENPIVTRSGEERLIAWQNTLLRDSQGKVIGTLSSGTDITDQRSAEAAVRKSEAKYRVLVEDSLQGIVIILGFPPRAVFANHAMARITGYSNEELLSLSIESLIHPDDRASFFDRFGDRLEGKPASSPFEYRLIRKDGKFGWVEISSSQIEYNGKSALQATIVDITERKKAEQIVLTEKAFSESVLSSLPGVFYMFDSAGKMLRWNRNFESVSGYASDEIARMSFLDFFVREEKELAQEKIQEVFERGASSVEAKFVSKDGHQTPLLFTGLLFRSENSSCLVGMGIDITERKKAERELLIKDNAIASSIDGMVIADLQGNVTYVNPVFVKMWGYNSDKEVIGKSIAELTRKGQSKEKADEIVKALGTKGGWAGEIKATRKDGSKFYAILSASLVKNEASKPICMLSSFVDITDRKKGEEALKESEERLRQLVEYAPDAIYRNDLHGNFLEGNKQAENLIGFKKEELVGKNILEVGVLPRKYAPKVMQDLVRNLQGQRTGPDEYELIRKDGTSVTAEISTFPIRREGKVEVIGIARDITERKQADKKLRESEEKLRNIIESSPDAIAITSLRGIVVDCNQATVSLSGFSSKEELIGKSASILIAKKDHQRAMENCKITAERGFLRNVSYTLTKKDGHEYPGELSASILKDVSGNPVGFVAVVRDVTERKQMQEKLEEYSQQLERMVEHRTVQLKDAQEQLVKSERLATIGQVAAMVGHDLRNPLTGISGAAYYLKMKLGPNAEKKMIEMLEVIDKDIQYSDKIITDLMEYSRETKLELTETTPKSIIAESFSLVQIPEKVQLTDWTLNEPRIKIDIDRMKRVFSNFMKNAVEAMPEGGKLTVSSRASGNDVEFMFIDTGVGMAKEVSQRIWTPFFTTKAKGMGLGLAICKRIIEAHQGRISVESIVGEGTTFTITIPLEPKPKSEGGEKVWVNVPESLLSTTTKP